MNILAVDYGTKRLGLAWSDTTLGAILPFGVIELPSTTQKAAQLAKLLVKEKIARLVVGYPLGMDGKENKNTERVQKFVFEVQKLTSVPVELYDERFSSYGADSMGEGVSRDERSAMFILEGYLERQKNKR